MPSSRLKRRHGELAHLHQALVHLSAQVVGGDAVLLHDLEEVLGDLQADLALAFHAAAHGVEAGVKVAVLAGGGILEEEIHHAGVLVQQDGFGLSVVQGFHVCFLPIFIVSRWFGLYRRYYSTTEGKTESLWAKIFSLLRRFFPLFSVSSPSLPLAGPAEWPLVEPKPLL